MESSIVEAFLFVKNRNFERIVMQSVMIVNFSSQAESRSCVTVTITAITV